MIVCIHKAGKLWYDMVYLTYFTLNKTVLKHITVPKMKSIKGSLQ